MAPMSSEELGNMSWCSDRWLAQQCYGIADALATVHGHSSLLRPDDALQTPKLHQDIKPDNILCFEEEAGYSLKLADFGFSLNLLSDGTIPKQQAIDCLTYRPPEAKIKDSKIGRSWDIWCLGCVYLELITWIIEGYSGVEAFRVKRLDEKDDHVDDPELLRVEEDVFYRRNKPKGIWRCFRKSKPQPVLEIKRSVTSVGVLHFHCCWFQ